MAPTRVLVVYGSESNTAKSNIERIVGEWKARGGDAWAVADVVEGNSAAADGLAALPARYDVLLVATSSFRQGDAPFNYDNFLGALYRAAGDGSRPLVGMQHAVLGFGDSHFDTYMNCPRLSDMLLETCGSRRLAQRREVDVRVDAAARAERMATWAAAAAASLDAGTPADAPPVCAWDVPGNGQTYDKALEYEPEPAVEAAGVSTVLVVGAAAVGAAAVAAYFLL